MFKLRTIVMMTASALATLGCASLTPDDAPKMSIRPLNKVRHGADANALYQTGRYFQGQIRYDKAISAYRDALAANPKQADAHNGLGVIYAIQGKVELAEQEFRAAIAAAPNAGYLHNNLGYHYLQRGRLDEALAAFERARELEPGNPRVAANLATAREKLGLQADGDAVAQPPVPAETLRVAAAPIQPSGAQAYTIEKENPRANAWTEIPAASTIAVTEGRSHGAENSPQRIESTPTKPIFGLETERTAQLAIIAPNVWELRSLGETATTPETSPVRRADPPAPATPVEQSPARVQSKEITSRHVEISNGNGITGLARRIAALLKPRGFERIRLTNQEPYGTAPSRIQYVASAGQAAAKIRAALPGELPLFEVRALQGDTQVRVVLGKDFSAGAPRPANLGSYRVEVSNGNGAGGLARRVAETLRPNGIEKARLTNRKPFGEVTSHVEYIVGAERAAEQIAAGLGVALPVAQVPTLDRGIQVKVVLGRDFPADVRPAETRNAARTTLAARLDFVK
jgi:hypothetical protein